MLNDIRSSTDAGGSIVSMFGNLIAGTGNHKTCGCRNIECVLAVTTRSYHVDITVCLKNSRNTRFKDAVTETKKFVNGYSPHLQTGKQSRYLLVGVFTVCNTNQDCFHFLTSQFLVV